MSLLACIKDSGIDPSLAKQLTDNWNAARAMGLSEEQADRSVLKDYGEQLGQRLNKLRSLAGLKEQAPVPTVRSTEAIMADYARRMRELKPERVVIPGQETEEFVREGEPEEKAGWITLASLSASDINPEEYTNHSGGADGADSAWHTIPKKLGYMTKDVHYREPGQKAVDSKGLQKAGVTATPISDELYAKGKEIADRIDAMIGENPNRGYGHYRYRNYAQVANADAVFAISQKFGERNGKFMPRDRGTIYAIYGAILDGKPVYVFDQYAEIWRTWDKTKEEWVATGTPTLTKNFAGVGTRTLLDAGRKAIEDVVRNTFGSGPAEVEVLSGYPTVPGPDGSKVYRGEIDRLADNQVFVFGANDQGLHGAGAAGAAMGQQRKTKEIKAVKKGTQGKWTVVGEHSQLTIGTEGKSWPLVTVEGELGGKTKDNRISPETLKTNIKQLYDYAKENPQMEFLVAYDAAKPNYAYRNGYLPQEMANMFAEFPIPDNVIFEEGFRNLMLNASSSFISGMLTTEDQGRRYKPTLTPEQVLTIRKQSQVEILDAEGKGTGTFFTSEQQVQAVDSILYEIQWFLRFKLQPGQKLTANTVVDYVRSKFQSMWVDFGYLEKGKKLSKNGVRVYENVTPEQAYSYRTNMEDVINSLPQLMNEAFRMLKSLNIKLESLSEDGLTEVDPELISQEGRGIEKFNELVFSINPRDLASGDVKFFMSTIEDVEYGTLPAPRPMSLKIQEQYRIEIAEGIKQYSFRGEQVMKEQRLSPTPGYDERLISVTDSQGIQRLVVVNALKIMTQQDADQFNAGPNAEYVVDKDTGERKQLLAKAGDTLLKFSPYVEQKGMKSKLSFIRTPVLANFDVLFEQVTGILADRTPSFEGYVKALEDSGKPTLIRLAERLRHPTTSDRIRKEFVQVMTKTFTEYVMVQYVRKKDGLHTYWVNANMYSMKRTVERNWKESQKVSEALIRDEKGQYMINPEVRQELQTAYDELRQIENLRDKAPKGDEKLNAHWFKAAEELARRMLEVNGIDMPVSADKALYNQATLKEYWRPGAGPAAGGLYSVMLNRMLGNIPLAEGVELEAGIEKDNPLYLDRNLMQDLVRIYVNNADVLFNSSHRDSEGNNIWDYTLPSQLEHEWNALVGADPKRRKELEKTFLAKYNTLLKVISSNADTRNGMKIMFMENMRKKHSKSSKPREKMSPREQDFLAFNLFANNGRDKMNMIALTHSDKTRTPVFMGIPRVKTSNPASQGEDSTYSVELIKRLYEVFNGEFDRIHGTAGKSYQHQQFDAGKGTFFLMPDFNYDRMKKLVGQQVKTADGTREFTQDDLDQIWSTVSGSPAVNKENAGTDRFKEVVEIILVRFIQRESTLQRQAWLRSGMAEIVTDGNGKKQYGTPRIDQEYIHKRAEPQSGYAKTRNEDGSVTYTFKGKNGKQVISEYAYNRGIIAYAATDYAMNSFLFNAFLVQTVTGDPAMVWKGSLAKTLVEYQKRLAGIIAPGKETEWSSPTYDAVTLADVKVVNAELAKISKKFEDINLTDAQELVTMEEHLDVLYHYGGLDKEVYDEMMAIVKAAGPGGYYEFTEARHKDVVLQITKPVYYGPRPEQDGVILHDYVKSSALALYPPWTKGFQLDGLRKQMEQDGVRRAHFESARKIGNPKSAATFDKSGEYTKFTKDSVTKMYRKFFRIQQEVPHDKDKSKIQIFSQNNKLFIADLPASITVNIPGLGTLNREGIRSAKEKLRINMLERNLQQFLKDNDVMVNVDEKFTFKNRSKFIARLIEEAKDNGYSTNELMPLMTLVDGEPIAPVAATPMAEPLHNLMMSIVDKVIKTKVFGRSYVQASSVGLTKMSEKIPDGVIWAPGSNPEEGLRFMRKADGGVQAAEVLVPFRFFEGKHGITLDSVMLPDGSGIDPEKLPLELLEMIGIRIPTSKQNTTLPIRIAGFLPSNMGDTIIVPPGITVQMGSDFDVDKLFIYQRPYYSQDRKLHVERDSDEANYFELQWQVLTHPDMFDAVVAPLDKDDLANETELGFGVDDEANAFTGRAQLHDFISQKDAKALVGFTALTNTFLASVQHLDLHLSQQVLDEETGRMMLERDFISTFAVAQDRPLQLTNLSGYGTSEYVNDLEPGSVPEIRTKMDNIGIIMQEALDHAKKRTLDKINLTVHAYSAVSALLSLETEDGQALDIRYATRLLLQEYIIKYSEKMTAGEDSMSGYNPALKAEVFNELFEDLVAKGANPERANEMTFTAENLKDLLTPDDTVEYYNAQYALLEAFRRLDEIGTRMNEITNLLNQDVNGTNGNLFSVLDKLSKADGILGTPGFPGVPIANAFKLLGTAEESTSERGWLFNNVNSLAAELFVNDLPHVMIQNTVLSKIKQFMGLTSMTDMPMDVKKGILKAMRSYMYSAMQSLGVKDPTGERVRLMYNTGFGESLARRLAKAKNGWGANNYFLRRLEPLQSDSGLHDSVMYQAAQVTRLDDADNVRAWVDLLTSRDPEQRLLGEDLVRYALLTGGVQDASSFIRYVPFGYLMSVGWFTELSQVYKNVDKLLETGQFLDQWFRHNPERAISMSMDFKEIGSPFDGAIPERFTLTGTDSTAKFQVPIKVQGESGMISILVFTPYISVPGADGQMLLYRKRTPLVDDGPAVYDRIDVLGDQYTDEYDAMQPNNRSAISANRTINVAWTEVSSIAQVKSAEEHVEKMIKKDTVIPGIDPFYAELGFTGETMAPGTWDHVVRKAAEHPNTPQHLAIMYNWLSNALTNAHHKVFGMEAGKSLTSQARLVVEGQSMMYSRTPEENDGVPVIRFPTDPKQFSIGALNHYVLDGFVHELIHMVATPYVNAYTNGRLRRGTDTWSKSVIEHIEALNELYQIALRNRKGIDDANVGYGLDSLDEFISHALTNQVFMRELNKIKTTDDETAVSFMDKFFEMFLQFMNAIAEAIGETVIDSSVLGQSLPHLLAVTTGKDTIYSTPLTPDTVQFNGEPVIVYAGDDGKAYRVDSAFMAEQPEPLRQQLISKILQGYTVNRDMDWGKGEPFRGENLGKLSMPDDAALVQEDAVSTMPQQREKADLISVIETVREKVKTGESTGVYPAPVLSIEDRVNTDNVTYLTSEDSVVKGYVAKLQEDPNSLTYAVIATKGAASVVAYNKAVRKALYGENLPKFVSDDIIVRDGKRLLVTEASSTGPESIQLPKELRVALEVRGITLDAWNIEATEVGTNSPVSMTLFSPSAVTRVLDAIRETKTQGTIFTKYAVGKDPYLRSLLGVELIDQDTFSKLESWLQQNSAALDYGYAVDVEKGSNTSYAHVFVDERAIYATGEASDQARTFQDAISRATQHLYIMNPENTAVPNASKASIQLRAAAIQMGSVSPWTMRNEQEAKRIKQELEQQYDEIKVEQVSIRLAAKAAKPRTVSVNPKIALVVEALEKQKQDVLDSMSLDTNKLSLAEKRELVTKIENDISMLLHGNNELQGGTMSAVAWVANRQLEWADRFKNRKDLAPSEINTAIRVTYMWGNIIKMLYSEHVPDKLDPALESIASRAQHLNTHYLQNRSRDVFNKYTQIKLKAFDFSEGLKDLPGLTTWALSLNRASSQLVQTIDLLMKNAARRREQEMSNMVKSLKDIEVKVEAFAKKAGISREDVFNMMTIRSGKGRISMVQQFSYAWYSDRGNVRRDRKKQLDWALRGLFNTLATAGKERSKYQETELAKIWGKYWDLVSGMGVFADVTKLFNEDGTKADTYDQEKTRLEAELGDLAPVALEQAEKLITSYVQDWEAHEGIALKRMAAGELTQEEMDTNLREFEEKYSPFRFMQAMNTKNFKLAGENEGDRYLAFLPKDDGTELYFDQRYETIQKDAGLKEIYEFYRTTMEKLKKSLPLFLQGQMYDNFLPAVEASLLSDMSASEYLRTMDQRIVDSLTSTEARETMDGKERLPLRFINFEEGKDYSNDLTRITEMFANMVYHYKHFAQVKDLVDLGEIFIKERHQAMVAQHVDGSSEGLSNMIKALEYAKDYMMYRNPRKVEGNTHMKLYSVNPIEQRRILKEVKALQDERMQLEQKLLDPPAGVTEEDIMKEIQEVDKKLTAYENRNIYMSKVGDRLIGINQLKALAFNPFSGIANMAFGVISLSIFAQGRREMTPKTVRAAMALVNDSTTKWLTFGAKEGANARKIFALMEKLGVMGDIVDSQYGESNVVSKKSRLRKNLDPYTFLRSSDYYSKALTMVAHMLHQQVEVQEGDTTKTVSLWEAYNEDGTWKYDNKEGWESDDATQVPKFEQFRNRVLRLTQIIMGNMDKNSPKLINKYILGRLIAQFRASWLPEGWALRFEDEKYDQQLGRMIKGRYTTYRDLGMANSIKVLGRQFINMFVKTDVFGGITFDGKELAQSETDMENMRRNFAGLMWTASIMGLVLLIRSLKPDDDDEDTLWYETAMIALNLVNRVNQDLRFYTSPDVANNLTRNVIPAFDVINDYLRAVKATNKAIGSEDYDWDQALLRWTKATPYANQINRVLYMSKNDISEISR